MPLDRQVLEHIHQMLHDIKEEVGNQPILLRIEAGIAELLALVKASKGDMTAEQEDAAAERATKIAEKLQDIKNPPASS